MYENIALRLQLSPRVGAAKSTLVFAPPVAPDRIATLEPGVRKYGVHTVTELDRLVQSSKSTRLKPLKITGSLGFRVVKARNLPRISRIDTKSRKFVQFVAKIDAC